MYAHTRIACVRTETHTHARLSKSFHWSTRAQHDTLKVNYQHGFATLSNNVSKPSNTAGSVSNATTANNPENVIHCVCDFTALRE